MNYSTATITHPVTVSTFDFPSLSLSLSQSGQFTKSAADSLMKTGCIQEQKAQAEDEKVQKKANNLVHAEREQDRQQKKKKMRESLEH